MFTNVEGLNLKPWLTVCLLPGTSQNKFMQEELRAAVSHTHTGTVSLPCPHFSFWANSFQFCAEFATNIS